ncbi:MAG: hypothetical protein GY941_20490 [Planctomycetes bacterium]|nr:hypothetical protein [Planctomycetota bacterium]
MTNSLTVQQDEELILVDPIDKVDTVRIPLTEELYANYKNRGHSEAAIGRFTGNTRQAVNKFKFQHIQRLAILCDVTGKVAGLKKKKVADMIDDEIINRLSNDEERKSIPVHTLAIAGGIYTDKSQLLQGRATENIAVEVEHIPSLRADIRAKHDALKYKLDKLKRVPVKVIDSVSSV